MAPLAEGKEPPRPVIQAYCLPSPKELHSIAAAVAMRSFFELVGAGGAVGCVWHHLEPALADGMPASFADAIVTFFDVADRFIDLVNHGGGASVAQIVHLKDRM